MRAPQQITEPILLRGSEAAELLGLSRAKVYRMMQQREIPVVTFGKSVRVPKEALLLHIRQRTTGGIAA